MKKIIFLLCVSIGLNLYATTVGDLTSAVCKDATYPCDICSNENSTMAQCKCEAGTSWNSTLKICESAKDACTSPAYWNDTKKTCEAIVTSTYAATTKETFPTRAVRTGDYYYCNSSGWYIDAGKCKSGRWDECAATLDSVHAYCDTSVYVLGYYNSGGKISINTFSPWQGDGHNWGGNACTYRPDTCKVIVESCNTGDGDPVNGICVHKEIITKASNCVAPSSGVTSSGKCYQNTSCPLGNYTCASTTANGGGTIDNTDTTQGATDKTANGTTNSSGQCSGKIYIFNGKDMRCRPPGMQTGYSDCCTKTDSWFGLTKCGTSEVALGKARVSGNSGDGYCHYVGSYCAEEWNLGVTKICVQKKKTYCCFNGLLGRVIQEQGRPQLGIGWGSAEGPECRGFTPDEFQKLDFSKIDLGEFTQAVTANAAANINKNLGPQINAEIDRFNSTIK